MAAGIRRADEGVPCNYLLRVKRYRRLLSAALSVLGALLAVGVLSAFSSGRGQETGISVRTEDAGAENMDSGAAGGGAADPESAWSLLPGAQEITAMAAVYPGRIDRAEVRGGEWALRMDERWYYWADGRLLPESQKADAELYVPIRFYRYELGPLQPRRIDEELAARLEERTSRQSVGGTDTRRRFNDFLDTLYRIDSRDAAERIVRRVELLGHSTRVHPLLVEPLRRVERTIRALMPHDPEVAAFVNGLSAVHGYNWRYIANTVRRSYHSYGVAVDLVPRSYGGQWPYWLWAAQAGIDRWWELTLQQRWTVPQPVINAFEAQGFIWGGKWLFFDNLHFEYRPESVRMARRREPE